MGLFEIGIISVLGYLVFRHIIARRYPGVYRALNFAFMIGVLLFLLFGLLARGH